jgi:O-antigen ligase
MELRDRPNLIPYIVPAIGLAGIPVGLVIGFLIGIEPIVPIVLLVGIASLLYFLKNFEQAVLALIVLRSSLDVLSDLQIPSAFAIGIDVLTLIYITLQLISRQKVQTDGFWWFLGIWVFLQGLWVILLPLGGLGLDGSALADAMREWIRLFSLLMVYLLVMQLKGRVPPEQVVNTLFLSLIAPLTAALLQVVLPGSLLPDFLLPSNTGEFGDASRINGTIGHPNSFATFSLLFLGLTIWKLGYVKRRLPWILLLSVIVFFLVASQSLTGLVMLIVFTLIFFVPRLSLLNLLGGILLLAIVAGLFLSTEIGQERLNELYSTPLLNPDIDWSRSVAMQLSSSSAQSNSFNWRVAQWTFLLQSWQDYPLLGYGLATSKEVSVFDNYAHNDYIRALVEGGIVGFTTFIVFLLAQAVRLVQLMYAFPYNASRQAFCSIMLALLMAMAVGMLAGNVMGQTPVFFYWWTLMAIAGWDWTHPQSAQPQSIHSRSIYDN